MLNHIPITVYNPLALFFNFLENAQKNNSYIENKLVVLFLLKDYLKPSYGHSTAYSMVTRRPAYRHEPSSTFYCKVTLTGSYENSHALRSVFISRSANASRNLDTELR